MPIDTDFNDKKTDAINITSVFFIVAFSYLASLFSIAINLGINLAIELNMQLKHPRLKLTKSLCIDQDLVTEFHSRLKIQRSTH